MLNSPDSGLSVKITNSQSEVCAIFFDFSLPADLPTEFLTPKKQNLQVGRIFRQKNSIVPLHKHLTNRRILDRTEEFLYVMSGSCEVYLYEDKTTLIRKVSLLARQGILLISGLHKITFEVDCELLEIKQGPYSEEKDKEIL